MNHRALIHDRLPSLNVTSRMLGKVRVGHPPASADFLNRKLACNEWKEVKHFVGWNKLCEIRGVRNMSCRSRMLVL